MHAEKLKQSCSMNLLIIKISKSNAIPVSEKRNFFLFPSDFQRSFLWLFTGLDFRKKKKKMKKFCIGCGNCIGESVSERKEVWAVIIIIIVKWEKEVIIKNAPSKREGGREVEASFPLGQPYHPIELQFQSNGYARTPEQCIHYACMRDWSRARERVRRTCEKTSTRNIKCEWSMMTWTT